jgi:hypothetical protein
VGEEGFPGSGPTLVDMPQIAAVRYNQRLIWGSIFDFFFLYLMWWQILFWLEAVRITQVWLQCLREDFGVTEFNSVEYGGFLLPYPSCHLGSSLFSYFK